MVWQGIVDEMWMGRSPACGRVRLRRTESVWLICLQMMLPFVRLLDTSINDLYKWPKYVYSPSSVRSSAMDLLRYDAVEISLTRGQHIIGLLHM